MKKFVALVLVAVMAFALCACGQSAEPAGSASASPTTAAPASGTSEASFDGTTLTAPDVKIEILSHEIATVGSELNAHGEKPLLIIKYAVTNVSGDKISASYAWISHFRAYQDNDPNILNELDTGILGQNSYSDTMSAEIKKGGTVENIYPYELDDLTTPVTLVALLNFNEVGETTLDIESLVTSAVADAEPTCTPETLETCAQLIEALWSKSLPSVSHQVIADSNLIVMRIEITGLAAQVQATKKVPGLVPKDWPDVIENIESLNSTALETARLMCGDDAFVGVILVSDADHDTAFLSTLNGVLMDNCFA